VTYREPTEPPLRRVEQDGIPLTLEREPRARRDGSRGTLGALLARLRVARALTRYEGAELEAFCVRELEGPAGDDARSAVRLFEALGAVRFDRGDLAGALPAYSSAVVLRGELTPSVGAKIAAAYLCAGDRDAAFAVFDRIEPAADPHLRLLVRVARGQAEEAVALASAQYLAWEREHTKAGRRTPEVSLSRLAWGFAAERAGLGNAREHVEAARPVQLHPFHAQLAVAWPEWRAFLEAHGIATEVEPRSAAFATVEFGALPFARDHTGIWLPDELSPTLRILFPAVLGAIPLAAWHVETSTAVVVQFAILATSIVVPEVLRRRGMARLAAMESLPAHEIEPAAWAIVRRWWLWDVRARALATIAQKRLEEGDPREMLRLWSTIGLAKMPRQAWWTEITHRMMLGFAVAGRLEEALRWQQECDRIERWDLRMEVLMLARTGRFHEARTYLAENASLLTELLPRDERALCVIDAMCAAAAGASDDEVRARLTTARVHAPGDYAWMSPYWPEMRAFLLAHDLDAARVAALRTPRHRPGSSAA
jgi:hypothetical protein